jgi:hypothetical protein
MALGPPFDEFERAGEAMVRDALEHGHYPPGRRASAVAWLGRKEEERRHRAESLRAEEIAIARSANDAAKVAAEAADRAASAAERQADAARWANRIAIIALAVAIAALAISGATALHLL